MPSWKDVPDEIKQRFPAPPEREKFHSDEDYEEARGFWQGHAGRNLGFVMQQYHASLPILNEYHVDTSSSKRTYVVINSKKLDWQGEVVGVPTESKVTVEEIKQLLRFCSSCENSEIRSAFEDLYKDYAPNSKPTYRSL